MTPLDPTRKRAYAVLNASAMPLWLAMIVAPRSRVTRLLVARAEALFLALGLSYTGLLASGVVRGRVKLDFADPEAVREALQQPDLFLAGWSHYVAFDLFVGRWIWQDALARGRTARLPLFLTLMAGPSGLALYLGRR